MNREQLNFSLEEMDRQSVFHPVTSIEDQQRNGPTIYARAAGSTVTDHKGKDVIDCVAGLWCVNVGYGRPQIAAAAAKAIEELSYAHMFAATSNEASIRLADRVLGLLRERAGAPQMARVFFGSSGSDANDTAYKLVRYYNNLRGRPSKKKVIALTGGYHGLSYASASLTGIPAYHAAFDLPIEGVLHAACPHYFGFAHPDEREEEFCERLLRELADTIDREGPETIAAFIAEPVMGTGGVIIPPRDYFAKVRALLDAYDILMIVDEVITGFGRTGQWFGTGTFGLRPDLITMAKGITSAYFPVSATAVSQGIWDVLEEASARTGAVMHGFTYSGHPVGSAIAMANLDIMEQEGLAERSAENGAYMLSQLRNSVLDHPHIGDIRGVGLMIGIEFVADKKSRRPFKRGANPHRLVAKAAAENGVLTRGLPFLDVNSFSPPLNISREEIDLGIERYLSALHATTPSLVELSRDSPGLS